MGIFPQHVAPLDRRKSRLQGSAVLLVVALVLAIFGPVFNPAGARAAVNPQIIVSDVVLTKANQLGNPEPGPLVQWNRAQMTFKWDASALRPVREGDQFTIGIPYYFTYLSGSPVHMKLANEDTVYGTCDRELRLMTCTFNAAAQAKSEAGFNEFRGTGKVFMDVVNVTDSVTADIQVSGTPIPPVPHPGNAPITAPPSNYYDYPPADKIAWGIQGQSREIQWVTQMGTKKLREQLGLNFDGQTEHTFVFQDFLGPGQRYNMDQAQWRLEQFQSQGMPQPYPESERQVATGAQPGPNFRMNVNILEDSAEGSRAEITVTGKFKPNTNYNLFYKSVPASGGTIQQGFEYTNDIKLEKNGQVISDKARAMYIDGAEVTITMKPGFGVFVVTKKASGPGVYNVNADQPFPVVAKWRLPGSLTIADYQGWTPPTGTVLDADNRGGTTRFDAKLGAKTPLPGLLPSNTTVELSEDLSVVPAPSGYRWKAPVFTVGDNNTPTQTITIEDQKSTAVGLMNSLEVGQQEGKFKVKKSVTGDYNGTANDQFTVKYDCGTGEHALTVTGDGPEVDSPNFPVGTTCDIWEDAASANKDGFTNEVSYELNDQAQQGDKVTIQIAPTTVPIVKVVNNYTTAVKPRVSVGDKVWWDENKDGIQNDNDQGVPGAVLTLYKVDGQSEELVTKDVDDKPVKPITTGDNGLYKFDNLPVLTGDQKYKVVVTPPAGYLPTMPKAPGSNEDNDSETDSALSVKDLKSDGKEDLSLDFGFIKKVPSPKNPKKGLASTGSTASPLTLTAAILALIGAAAVSSRRKRS